ncbi:MAG: hypothetical protein II797_02150, partial [Clostridia bacterium]|nr:hypothetical protein [Clostridia bacterium]
CVNAMKDDRHSFKVYKAEEDPNGTIASLTGDQKKLLEKFVKNAREGKNLTLTEKEYGKNLVMDALTIYRAFSTNYPDLASYTDYSLDGNNFTIMYYNPYKDQNFSVLNGEITKKEVLRAAELLDRVVDRIIRLMPENLSTYDRYYYLAAVLSEHVVYDSRTRNCFTAFGALVSGRAVCEGYENAYRLLCQKANLWCGNRSGLPEGVGHGWNLIKLESGTYNVDVTWCDTTDPCRPDWYQYFVKSEQDFIDDGHEPSSGYAATGQFEPNPYEETGKKR